MTLQNFDGKNDTITPEQVQYWDHKHLIHPWSEFSEDSFDMTQVSSADGIYLYDAHGNKLIDGPGGMWCVNIGYGRKEMADAISQQIMNMTYSSPWFTTNEPAAMLAKVITEKTPGDLNRVFFSNGGSDAVDTALRFVQYRNNVIGKPDKKEIKKNRTEQEIRNFAFSASFCFGGYHAKFSSFNVLHAISDFLTFSGFYGVPEVQEALRKLEVFL